MQVTSVREADVSGKKVLLRVDFNVPIEKGVIVDDARIKAALPTINFLLEHGAAHILVLAHLGRPGGKVIEDLRIAPVAARLKELCPSPVVSMLENVRFNPGEEANDPTFAAELAAQGDIYVSDAFADAHRTHASIVGVPKLLPSYAGLLMEKEIEKLSAALEPAHPSIAIIGGAKFETKIPLLTKLASAYDTILLGGALANDLLKSRGAPVGASLVSSIPVPMELAGNEKILAPVDGAFMDIKTHMGRTSNVNDIRVGESMVDIGPETSLHWATHIAQAKFILWNGPVGVYEDGYVEGTDALAQALVASGATAVIGGGDTDAALKKIKFDPAKVFISTGGGAMLEFLANNGTLPGIEVLKNSATTI